VWWLWQEYRDDLLEVTCEELTPQSIQQTPTQASHIGLTTSQRGLSQKFSDWEAGPLCTEHHRAAHMDREWWDKLLPGLDRDALLAALNQTFEAQR
jgi:hypothetical protein